MQNAPFFTKLFGGFVTFQWADRVVGPYGEISMHSYPVGADDSVRPRDAPLFTGICGESVLPCNFECKADLPHPFKGTDSQDQLFRNRRRVSKRS